MSTTTRQVSVPLWHYSCPECGVGHQEMGALHQDHALYCEVCLEDKRPVKLKRWHSEDEPGYPKGPPTGA